MMKYPTAAVRVLAAAFLIVFSSIAAAQSAYPNKMIRLIVPFPPGGSNNILARLVAQKLTESWGQQVLVDNRPGGNGIIGGEALARATPDGYTIMQISSTHIITSNLLPTPYDTIRDFAPVATIGGSELVLVLHPSVPANNLRDFIALARSKPGQLNHASPGTGSVAHLASELFNIMASVKLQDIPYKGGAPAIADLIGGQVHLSFNVPLSVIPHVKAGRLKAIAVSGDARLSAIPYVPTFSEAGLPGFDVRFWQGVLAPAGTPKAIIDKLSAEIARILAMPDIKEKMDGQGIDPFISTPDQFAALIRADMAKFAKIIKTANIKVGS